MKMNTFYQVREEMKSSAVEANQKLNEAYTTWTLAFIAEREAYEKWSIARDKARRETSVLVEYEMTLSIHENLDVVVNHSP